MDTDISNVFFRSKSETAESYEYKYKHPYDDDCDKDRGEIKVDDIPTFSFRCKQPFVIGCEGVNKNRNDRKDKTVTLESILGELFTSLMKCLKETELGSSLIDQLSKHFHQFIGE